MSKSNKLVFLGNERLATGVVTSAPTLRALVAADYSIEAVVASHSDSISRQKRELEIGTIAEDHNIPVLLPADKISLADKLKHCQADAAVLVAFGQIIPQDVIDLFPKGIINIHPSLLPKLRGPTPIESAILEGLDETGVSLMRITAAMDEGPIYAQHKIALKGIETKFELAKTLNQAGAEILVSNLDNILNGSLAPQAQDSPKATYTHLLTKNDGNLNFKEPAVDVERKVRAFLGWPKARATIFSHNIIISKARVAKSASDGSLVMECQPGWLEIQELTAPSGRTITGTEFLRGYAKG